MSQFEKLIILFACMLFLTVYRSYLGDDDVVYKFMDRKPTPQESIIRIRWVLLKAFAAISGGVVLASAIIVSLRSQSIHLSESQLDLLFFASMGVVVCLIGFIQNGIRLLTGRRQRPIIDVEIWRRNFGMRR